MSRAPERSKRWLRLLRRLQDAVDEQERRRVEADIRTSTEEPVGDLRRDLGELLTGERGRLRLAYALDAADLYHGHVISDGAAELLDAGRARAFDRIEEAVGLADDGQSADAFLALCDALCVWARDDRETADSEMQRRRAEERELVHRRGRLLPLSGRLRSAELAVLTLAGEGVCEADEAQVLPCALT